MGKKIYGGEPHIPTGLSIVEKVTGYSFKNKELIKAALRHSSVKKYSVNFERLEFLGDRVLGLVITEYIFRKFEKKAEGELAKMQAAFICSKTCCEIAKKLGIDKEIFTAGRYLMTNKTVLADAMEAVLGAIFLDSNFDVVKDIILNLWQDMFENFDAAEEEPKTKLQEISQAKTGQIPKYTLLSVQGPDHCPTFKVSVSSMEKEAIAEGSSKKIAETLAAQKLLDLID
ncbi:MAG: ribonuclease III [Holosporales bacterium]|jgi:ribonuclease-3|nr:ribonuclease III [Holosporales bacterium]